MNNSLLKQCDLLYMYNTNEKVYFVILSGLAWITLFFLAQIFDYWWKYWFWAKYWFITKIMTSGQNLEIWQKSWFLKKFLISDENIDFGQILDFWAKSYFFCVKILISDRNLDFRATSDKNLDFLPKSWFMMKM